MWTNDLICLTTLITRNASNDVNSKEKCSLKLSVHISLEHLQHFKKKMNKFVLFLQYEWLTEKNFSNQVVSFLDCIFHTECTTRTYTNQWYLSIRYFTYSNSKTSVDHKNSIRLKEKNVMYSYLFHLHVSFQCTAYNETTVWKISE